MIPGEKTQPLRSGLHWVSIEPLKTIIDVLRYYLPKVRDEAAVVRQEGARRNGSERVGFGLMLYSLLETKLGACSGECFPAGGAGRSAEMYLPAQPLRGSYSCC